MWDVIIFTMTGDAILIFVHIAAIGMWRGQQYGHFRYQGFGGWFGFRFGHLVWRPERVTQSKRAFCQNNRGANLAWAKSKAEAVVSKRDRVSKCLLRSA